MVLGIGIDIIKIAKMKDAIDKWGDNFLERVFNEEETNLILKGRSLEELPIDTKKKIKDFDLENYYYVLPRNLGVFFK